MHDKILEVLEDRIKELQLIDYIDYKVRFYDKLRKFVELLETWERFVELKKVFQKDKDNFFQEENRLEDITIKELLDSNYKIRVLIKKHGVENDLGEQVVLCLRRELRKSGKGFGKLIS